MHRRFRLGQGRALAIRSLVADRAARAMAQSRSTFKGSDFRLVAALQYRAGVLVIRFFGARREYDAINAETV
jgi:mRNA-degrading endonuclease HigB of HigAB toxin-antitoxin module